MDLPTALRAAGVTAREAEVLDALGARLTNAEIAERFHISVRTVENHVSALLRKLGEPDRRALAARAHTVLAAKPVPLPRSLVDAIRGMSFVGRTGELSRLRRLSEVTQAIGVRRLALVTGEAGIGKSRLAAETAARLHSGGAAVVHGRCAESALIPYQAFVEAVRPFLGDGDSILRVTSSVAENPGAARYALFEEFDRLLASRQALVVLVIDDVQWIDASGLQLLRHLLHHVDRSSLLVIATGRPEVTDPQRPLAATLAFAQSAGALDVIPLSGLTVREAETLAGQLQVSGTERVRAAWRRTGGNPFLMSELLRHSPVDGRLPTTARDAIVRRVAGLGPSVFDALSAAAVAGEVFRLDVLTIVLAGDPAAHTAAVELAFSAGLVVEDATHPGTYRFTHAIVREALTAIASPGQRSRVHLLFAAALEPLGPAVAADIARHRHAALPSGDLVRSRRGALAAADQAMTGLAYELAVSYADMAIDAIDAGGGDEADRAEALLRRGRAQLATGDLQRATADCRLALELATRSGAHGLRAQALLGWADAAPVWGREPQLLAALDRILADGVDDLGLRSRIKAKLAQLLYYEHDHARQVQLSREALNDARHSGRDDVLASVLAATHAAIWDPAALTQRIEVAREIATVAAVSHHGELEMEGLGWLAVDLLEAGDLRAADHAFARHKALAQRLQQRLPLRDVEMWTAMRAILDGRFDDAPQHIERARDLGDAAHDPATESIYFIQRYWLAVERADPHQLDELVDPCVRLASNNTDVPAWRAAVALLHARRHDHTAAGAEFHALAVDDFRAIPRDAVWLNAITFLAETCAFLDDQERARLLLHTLKPYVGHVALIDRALACKGSVQRFLGLLAATAGKVDEAERHLSSALAWHQRMHATALAERTAQDLDRLSRR
jgi:predicted ATPase/DNA-binding CsgD family transcriptional regulator